MTWPGGKNGSGAYQRIINYMPPHKVYIEPFLGSGAVLRNKRPAERNVGIDKSAEAISLCLELGVDQAATSLFEGDALALLPGLDTMLADPRLIDRPDTLVYADPPYLMETRRSGEIYEHELSDKEHETLLEMLLDARCMVMISGYRSVLYDEVLKHWHRVNYWAGTRRGMVDESLWMNFAPPSQLHDYSHLGDGFRERERIKRKKERWAAKIAKMDRLERLAVMEALETVHNDGEEQ